MRQLPPFFTALACVMLARILCPGLLYAQQDESPGHSIGKVSIRENLIVVELNDGALGKANLFDLGDRTLRFLPGSQGYRIENVPLKWDSEFGSELKSAEVHLSKFRFPFSGRSWTSFLVGITGYIRFGSSENPTALDSYSHPDPGGISLGRFDQLSEDGRKLVEKAPLISVFLKPRLTGQRYVKELADRLTITWDLSEPFGSLLDFSWFPTVNRFQTVLYRDGTIEMSYKEVAARDAIVGIYSTAAVKESSLSPLHFSAVTLKGGPYTAAYEAFHYLAVPKPQDLSCTIIQALGDRFDFLSYYSDFRVDNQEASSPSDGPVGGEVKGIGDTQHDQSPKILASRCTKGRFQLGFDHPVYVGSNEMEPAPPEGAPALNSHVLPFYSHQLSESSPDHKPRPYDYAISHLGHEVAHRWSAYVSAKVNGKIIPLIQWPHWERGLQTQVAFPYELPTEASTLGGGVWQDNFDGTYTQLHDGYFVPAPGYSPLDLYLMGFISAAEVPDFFLLRNLAETAKDGNGRRIFKADRIKVTIGDVIAAEGPRVPDVDHSQRTFNTGVVVVVEHGREPSSELLQRAEGIRRQWIQYWETVTGRRASMETSPSR